jgi:hypothetical protein
LKTIGSSDCVIIGNGLAVNDQGSVTMLCANYEASFYNPGKNENGLGLFGDNLR